MTIPNQDLKICSKCRKAKPAKEFYLTSEVRRSLGWDSLQAECRWCTRARIKANADSQRPKLRANQNVYAKAMRVTIRDVVFAAYGGYVCVCCGETNKNFLTLDHVHNDGAEWRRKIFGNRFCAGYRTYKWLMEHGFPSDIGIQVMCMNCNHGKRMNHGQCPHQVRRNDQGKPVGPSGPKREAPIANVYMGEEMISTAMKIAAAGISAGLI